MAFDDGILNAVQDKLNSLQNFLNNLKEKKNIVDYLAEAENKFLTKEEFNEAISQMMKRDEATGKFDTLTSKVDASNYKNEIIVAIREEIGKVIKSEEVLEGIRKELQKEKNEALEKSYEEFKSEKEKAVNELRDQLTSDKENALKTLKEELKSKKEEELNLLRQTIETEKEKVRESMQKELQEKTNELEKIRGELEKKNQKLTHWESVAKIYEDTKNAMENAEIFREFLESKNLKESSDFIRAIGENIEFAKAVHDRAMAEKRQNKAAITEEEKAVYSALNVCYRSVWSIDFDIFVCPPDKSVNDNFEKHPFSYEFERDIDDPKNKNFKNAQELYVPVLKNKEGKIYAQSYVKAGNN